MFVATFCTVDFERKGVAISFSTTVSLIETSKMKKVDSFNR